MSAGSGEQAARRGGRRPRGLVRSGWRVSRVSHEGGGGWGDPGEARRRFSRDLLRVGEALSQRRFRGPEGFGQAWTEAPEEGERNYLRGWGWGAPN